MKRKNRGPSCFGTVMLFAAIVLMLKFAYSRLPGEAEISIDDSDNQQPEVTLYDAIYDGLKTYSTEITFGYDCTAELFDTFERVCDDHPELFWVKGSGTYEKRTAGEDVSVTFFVDTELTLVEILRCQSELNRKKDEILGSIGADLTDYEKILYIHDVLVRNTEYDSVCAEAVQSGGECTRLWQSSSVYGCLVNNLAICSGYAASFKLLMNELGIDCIRVTGHERESGVAHEWNCVKLGDEWYYVDVTWDDPLYDNENSYFKDIISYEYCMITEDVLSMTHVIGEGESVPICDDESYSYYRREGVYLDFYSYEGAAGIIKKQLYGDVIEIAFPDEADVDAAVSDLFDNYRFYDIEGVSELGDVSVTYSKGKNGLLRIVIPT